MGYLVGWKDVTFTFRRAKGKKEIRLRGKWQRRITFIGEVDLIYMKFELCSRNPSWGKRLEDPRGHEESWWKDSFGLSVIFLILRCCASPNEGWKVWGRGGHSGTLEEEGQVCFGFSEEETHGKDMFGKIRNARFGATSVEWWPPCGAWHSPDK